jgi:hypothetical protein
MQRDHSARRVRLPLAGPAAALGLLVVATAFPARAADATAWQVNAGAAVGTPAALTSGFGLGATAEVQRRLRWAPLFVAGRLGWMEATAANQSWVIDHHQLMLAASAGAMADIGAGRIWAQAGGGAGGLYERLSRHQRERIDAAGVPGGVETSFTLGPYAFAEIGVALRLRGAAGGFLAAGPTLVRTSVEGRALWRWGGGARLGVAYDF